MSKMTSIEIDYKHRDGWHIFTSCNLPGLYVASQDPAVAYGDIPQSVEKLLLLNTGFRCRAKPELSFEEFMRKLADEEQAAQTPVLQNQRYLLEAA